MFLISTKAAPTVAAGANLSYTVDYSVSYVNDRDVVIYLPVPTVDSASFNHGYNQDLSLSFKSATQGGQFTSKSITVDGINIPANSVYWRLGAQNSGVTGSLGAIFGTKNGTQNGVKYQANATIVSPNTAAVVSDSDKNTDGNQPTITTIESTPSPSVNKNATGIWLNSKTHVYSGAPHNNKTTYSVTARNSYSSQKVETIFNPVVTDDLSDIFTKLTNVCAVTDPAARISGISDSGVLDVAAKTITWKAANMNPSDQKTFTFTVDYSGCAKDTEIDNTVTFSADNTQPKKADKKVIIGVDASPGGMYGKTERTRILPNDTYMEDTTTYLLSATNTSAVRLDNTVMMDKIPDGETFVSATLPSNAKGKIFYYTLNDHTDPDVQPAFDYNNLNNPGAGWSQAVPDDNKQVKWVAFYVPCLSPTGLAAGGSCADRPGGVTGEITVKIDRPVDVCKDYNINNKGIFNTYSSARDIAHQEDSDVVALTTPISYKSDKISHIVPNLANFNHSSGITGKSEASPAESVNYDIRYTNSGTATAKNTTIEIPIPEIEIGGTQSTLDFVNFTGGQYTKETDAVTGKIKKLTVNVGDIPSGASRKFTITLSVPRGPRQNSTYTVNAILRASDPNNCAPINQSLSATTTVKGAPRLQILKTRDEALIKSGGDVHYQLQFSSIGDTPTTDTFVIDHIPERAIFKQAYTAGKDANSTEYSCHNCKVYFALRSADLPANISAENPLTPDVIYQKFSLGIQTSPGVWAPPASMQPKDVAYVAYLVDDTTMAKPQLNSGKSGLVGLTVTNDDDGDGPSVSGSNPGALISNYPSIISNDTLQAIGNTTHTTILDDPGLVINKHTNTPIVTAAQEFDWLIDYNNDSQNNDTVATITDTLPNGVQLKNIYHKWNDLAVQHGMSGDESDITGSAYIETTTNPDGTTAVKVTIAQALRGGDLQPQEGGRLRLRVKLGSDVQSGRQITNTARGCYQNQVAGPFCLTSDSSVTVENADLWLRKQVNNTQPLSGDQLIYSLVITNKGKHVAENTKITDTLPAGICYESINIVTPSGWTIGPPTVTGGPCQTNPTTLTWDTPANSLRQNGQAPGLIPGESVDITIQYNTKVHTSVAPGTSLTNGAEVTTTTPEDPTYPNGDNKTATTPLPDPYVRKNTSSPTVLPGDSIDYFIQYGNNSREAAQGAIVVDGLPDYDGDGKTDVTILSVVPQNGERIYYYDENNAPKLNTLNLSATYNFTANTNFKSSLNDFTAGTYPTHIIIVPANNGILPGLDGPHDVMVKMQMTNPYTQTDTPAGTTVTNHSEITSTTKDEDPDNNQSDSSTKTPNADLEIKKAANPSGNYPGVAPGGQITYTINFANKGIAPVCGVYISEQYPAKLENISHNFTELHLLNSAGMPVLPIDTQGKPIGSVIPVTYDESAKRWQLGGNDYQNVCLPSGANGSFQIFGTVADDTPDKSNVENIITIGEDSPATEDTLENNKAKASTTVYRADLRIKKEGMSAGADGVFNTADDSLNTTNATEKLRYKLSYNNDGNLDAKNTEIKEIIPEGTCFTVGSVADVPQGSKVEYSNDGGNTYTYIPVGNNGDKDCNVTNFRVKMGTLPAPASIAAGSLTQLGKKQEFMGDVKQLHAYYPFAIKNDGTLWAWGNNSSGQLGDGTHIDRTTPFQVLDNVKEFYYYSNFIFAIKNDGTLWAWGKNNYGQVGNGSTTTQYTPVQVLDNVKEVYYHFAIKNDGTLWAWGNNNFGQLGNGTTTTQYTPVQVHGTGHIEYLPATGTTNIPLSAPSEVLAWKGLYIQTDPEQLDADAKVKYHLMEQNCTTPVAGFQNLDPTKSPIDISSLPNTKTNYCLKVEYTNVRQMIVTARMSYASTVDPSISFDVVAQDNLTRTTIDNTATISTDTPETNYNNNSSNYRLRVPQADVELDKTVDVSAVSPADIAGGKQLTYTITVKNNGPNDANKPKVTDTLPAGVTYVSAVQTAGAGGFTVAQQGREVIFTSAGSLAVGETATFQVKVTVDAGAAAGQQFINDACVASQTADGVKDNNCDSATVTVGSYANVYLQKTGPVRANINKEITYTLKYGNNGNVAAGNWQISDPLSADVDFVGAEQKSGTTKLTCNLDNGSVKCTPDGGAALPVGETGTVEVVVRVKNDQTLADNNTPIKNRACIATDTTQITVSDDCGEVTTVVQPGALAGFGGRVFLDFDKDVAYKNGTDKPLGNVSVYASGYDTKGNIYGPAANDPQYATVMANLLPALIDAGVVPAGTTVNELANLAKYVRLDAVKTASDGTYSFNGLKPGKYFAYEVQPVSYGSTGSTGGYLSVDSNTGLPVVSPKDGKGSKQDGLIGVNYISGITLGEGDFSRGNDFGELPGSIGNYIWKDMNNNGRVDAGEEPLVGVEVTLYRDVDGNGAYTAGVDTVESVTKTNERGEYLFGGLSVDDGSGGAKYVVVVTDKDRVLADYINSRGVAGQDNESQNPAGYGVVLSPTKDNNLTADFGYYRAIDLQLNKEVDGNLDGNFVKEEKILPGVEFEYRITVGNSSLDTATGVVVQDQLPAGTSFVSATPNLGTATENNGVVTWNIGKLSPTAQPILTIRAVVKNSDMAAYHNGLNAGGKSVNTARISVMNEVDGNPNNNSSSANNFMEERVAVGDTVWNDKNHSGLLDAGESGLAGVSVLLFKDDGDDKLDVNNDTQVKSTHTDTDGKYLFEDLDPGKYFVVIPGDQLAAGGALEGYKLSQTIGSDPNDNVDNVNDGILLTDAGLITTVKAIDLQYGAEPSDNGARNNTVDFGFYIPEKPVVPPQPNKPSGGIDLANTGANLLLILAGAASLIIVSIMILLGVRKRQRR